MEFTFDDFKKLAKNPSLSKWEKIGFPNSYREGIERLIFQDIKNKLKLNSKELNILDIGCGCGGLVDYLIFNTIENNSSLYLVDSKEMLENINKELQSEKIHMIPGYFPKIDFFDDKYSDFFDCILVYSVIQYVFLEQSIFEFIHKSINLLKHGGKLLIGDIPNISVRERFISSEEGKIFIKNKPLIIDMLKLKHERHERIDDSVVISIINRFRNFGCETYLLPQPKDLPFGNRREDILIIKR